MLPGQPEEVRPVHLLPGEKVQQDHEGGCCENCWGWGYCVPGGKQDWVQGEGEEETDRQTHGWEELSEWVRYWVSFSWVFLKFKWTFMLSDVGGSQNPSAIVQPTNYPCSRPAHRHLPGLREGWAEQRTSKKVSNFQLSNSSPLLLA